MTPSDTQGPLQPGALLAERYHIEHVLHAGSPDRRYLARDQQDGMRALLLQELPAPPCPTRAAREEATAWLAARVEQLCGMAHPGLCPVRGFHAPRALAAPFYLIHDHVPGMTLAEEYEEADGDLSWRQVLDWGIALCDALAYLHGRQPPYVLGSLHPRHVVLEARDRRPRVIDAGVARWLMPVPVAGWGLIAFEQLIGREDPRSDLYALGATLHTLLSGHDADAELGRLRRAGMDVQRALRQLYPRLDAVTAGISPALCDVVARALAFSPEDRFPDAEAMGAALRALRGPAVAADAPRAQRAVESPVWERLGLTQQQWFALPLAERNRRLLGAVQPPPPERD